MDRGIRKRQHGHITLPQTTKFGAVAGSGIVSMLAGESIYIGIKNIGNDDNPTIRYVHIYLQQL